MKNNFRFFSFVSIFSTFILLSLPSIAMDLEENQKGFRIVTKSLDSSSLEDNIRYSPSSIRRNRSEGFLVDNISKMKKERKLVQDSGKEIDLYICNPQIFDEFFPVSKGEDFESDCAGQIQIRGGRQCATGTLVHMQYNDDKTIDFRCITALHVFVGYEEDHGLFIKHDREFVLGRKEAYDNPDKVYSLGTSSIEKVKVLSNPRDVCLFEGKFIPNHKIFDSKEEFFNEFKDKLPKFVQDLEAEKVDASMHHYPLGTKSQRKNIGNAYIKDGTHKMESVYGSSGASLLNEKSQIFGIHTGCKHIFENEAVTYGERNLPITDYNKFELFFEKDYNDLVDNGIDIYGVPFHTLPASFKEDLTFIAKR